MNEEERIQFLMGGKERAEFLIKQITCLPPNVNSYYLRPVKAVNYCYRLHDAFDIELAQLKDNSQETRIKREQLLELQRQERECSSIYREFAENKRIDRTRCKLDDFSLIYKGHNLKFECRKTDSGTYCDQYLIRDS